VTARARPPAEGSDGRPLRVLIVEDEAAHAELEICALRHAGFAVYSKVVDTEAGYLEALTPDIDLIISDNSLPRFNALQAADALRERGLDVPMTWSRAPSARRRPSSC